MQAIVGLVETEELSHVTGDDATESPKGASVGELAEIELSGSAFGAF